MFNDHLGSFVLNYYGCLQDMSLSLTQLIAGPIYKKIVSEYDQEIPQSQTADNPMAPRGRANQPSRDIRKTN